MTRIFKQKSNLIQAISFAGLIIVSQLMVLNMGYSIPVYFLILLVVLCILIIWSLLDIDCMIEDDFLIIKSGPFRNKILIDEIDLLNTSSRSLFKGKKAAHELKIVYSNKKRLSIFPVEKEEMIKALKSINPKIKVE